MLNVHSTVGTLVLVAFLILTVVNVLRATGRVIPWARPLSFAAATLLLLQYLLGFSVLSDEKYHIGGEHWGIALLAILTVGFEHGYANSRPTERDRGTFGAIATGLTFVLVLIAYIIGMGS